MYKLPWSATDNQGGWIEVTDRCNLTCPGCYRQRLDGDKPLATVKSEILLCRSLTNCDTMIIAGGEPLIYPHIVEVVGFISSLGLKPLILSNGVSLSMELGKRLKKAGLRRIHLHVDSRQDREGWTGKTECELNALRQYFADLLWDLKGVQCGFHVTLAKETLQQIPDIMKWFLSNMHKVQHLSLIALSGVPAINGGGYYVNGIRVPDREMLNHYERSADIGITTNEIFDYILTAFPMLKPSAFINGDSVQNQNKQLFIVGIGSRKAVYGVLGAKSMELTQSWSRLVRGRYFSFVRDPVIGKKVFLLSLFDQEMRKTLIRFAKELVRSPVILFYKMYIQSLIIQQPIDFLSGEKNICEHCVNPMVYHDLLINPCELDEFRVFGGMINPVILPK